MALNLIYLLLDAARMEDEIEIAKEMNPDFDSLYRGRSEETLSSVAPYIFKVNRGEQFEKWYFEKGWGVSWGVLVYSQDDMKSLHKHFRQFLMVKTEDGEELYFRFYDPRVLRIFLPTCDKQQLKEMFGPVDCFICEDEDPSNGLVFSFDNDRLHTEKISKEIVMNFEPGEKKKRFSIF
jgi:hypothetical protein